MKSIVFGRWASIEPNEEKKAVRLTMKVLAHVRGEYPVANILYYWLVPPYVDAPDGHDEQKVIGRKGAIAVAFRNSDGSSGWLTGKVFDEPGDDISQDKYVEAFAEHLRSGLLRTTCWASVEESPVAALSGKCYPRVTLVSQLQAADLIETLPPPNVWRCAHKGCDARWVPGILTPPEGPRFPKFCEKHVTDEEV